MRKLRHHGWLVRLTAVDPELRAGDTPTSPGEDTDRAAETPDAQLPVVGLEDEDPLAMELMHARLFGSQGEPVKVGRFTVIERLGSDGMGVVYAAYDPELDRKVALKLVSRGAEGGSESDRQARLVREAQALAKLSRLNVVTVHEVGLHRDGMWVAMEFVAGQTLGVRTSSR